MGILVFMNWTKITYIIIPTQLFNMAESMLEITLDDDDVDINYGLDSNPSSESDPIVCEIGQIPPEMIL